MYQLIFYMIMYDLIFYTIEFRFLHDSLVYKKNYTKHFFHR